MGDDDKCIALKDTSRRCGRGINNGREELRYCNSFLSMRFALSFVKAEIRRGGECFRLILSMLAFGAI